MVIEIMDIKLNSGFFKTENYVLSIEEDRLILLSDEYENINILKEHINTLNLIIKNLNLIEFEINTKEKNYTGIINELINVEEVIRQFKDELGDKFKLELN